MTKAQIFLIYKSIVVIVINENKYLIVTLNLEDFNNSQKLLIVNFISNLFKNYLLILKLLNIIDQFQTISLVNNY